MRSVVFLTGWQNYKRDEEAELDDKTASFLVFENIAREFFPEKPKKRKSVKSKNKVFDDEKLIRKNL